MLFVRNRRFKKQHVIGGAGIFDSLINFLVRTFTSTATKQIASSAAKEVGKAALEAGKSVAVDAGKKLIQRAMESKSKSKKGSAVDTVRIQDLVKRLNGSGLKNTI